MEFPTWCAYTAEGIELIEYRDKNAPPRLMEAAPTSLPKSLVRGHLVGDTLGVCETITCI